MPDNQKIQMTIQEIEQRDRAVAMQTKLDILIKDFQAGRTANDKHFVEIFSLFRGNEAKLHNCRDELQKEIKATYMTQAAGEAMELRLSNNLKSVKTWIVTTVGGFTAAGLLVLWALNIIHISYSL
jgi:hypothetical protein